MKTQQMEIGFDGSTSPVPVRDRPLRGRRHRSRWWFHRMREVVNQAWDWKPVPAPRPEQIYLALAQGR